MGDNNSGSAAETHTQMQDVQAMRSNPLERDDFLAALARDNTRNVGFVCRNTIGIRATEDLIRNEAMQAFLQGANRAIDSFHLEDDGRGNNSLVGWCRFKGLNTLRDFLRVEFGNDSRNANKANFQKNVVFAEDLYGRHAHNKSGRFATASPSMNDHQSPTNKYFRDPSDYAEQTVSVITVQEAIRDLSPVDRSIVELLVFGEDQFGTMKTASRYGSAQHHLAEDIARSINMSHQFVYKRLKYIREHMRTKLSLVS